MAGATNTDVASQISNKKYTILASTWYNGGWINMSDTNQRNNMQDMLNGVDQQVKQAQAGIKTAQQAADNAMSSASAAIESSKVNSQAIIDNSSAVNEAKSDAATAFDQAKSAMSAATVNSESISELNSSVAESLSSANQQISEAKANIDSNAAAVADDVKALNSSATSISTSVKNLESSVTANSTAASTAINANSTAIASVQTIANSAKSASVTATSTANAATTTATDAKSAATVATQTASEASVVSVNAQSDATVAKQTASGASMEATNAHSDAIIATQTASTASITATNAQSDAIAAITTASGASVTATNANKTATTANITANSASVLATSANSNAVLATTTASAATVTATNASKDATSAKVTASSASVLVAAANSNAVLATATASAASVTATAANKTATTATQTASEASITAVNAQSEANTVSVTASETKVALSNAKGDISALQVSASQASLDIASNSSAVASVTATAKELQTTVSGNSSAISGLKTTMASQATQLSQTTSEVALKADQTAVDTLKDTVTANSAAISVQADEIKQKVTSSDVQGLLNKGGYATQTWTSSQIDLTSNKFSLNLSALQTQVDNSAVGTNLFINSKNMQTTLPSGTPSITGKYSRTDSYEQVTAPASGEYYYRFIIPITNNLWGLIAGETYTISGQTVITSGELMFRAQANNGTGWYNFFGDSTYDLKATNSDGATYTSFSYTFTVPTGATGIYLSLQAYGYTTNTVFRFKKMKLEKGSVATDWCPNPADNASVTSVTNLEATVDGLQTTVSNKVNTTDYNSKMTQLSDLIDGKVSTADYNAEVAILANDIDLKVAKGDVVSQINEEAGGNTLIQVASGKGKLYLDAATTVFGGTAFISDAMITSLNVDKLTGGTIDGKLISANALNVALDNWSSNLQLAPNGLTIINGGITALQMDYSGLALFDPTTNTSVGKIHGAAYDNAKNPGLAFDLDTHGDFMAWTVQDDASEGYNSKLLWTRDDLASKLNIQYGFHVSDNITFHGNIYPEDATHADASHVHFQDITVNGARGFGIVNDLGCGIVICDNKTVWAVKQTNGTATQILG